jgi:hypothetical protein
MQLGQVSNVVPFTAGCSTALPEGSSARPHAAPEIKPSACRLSQIAQTR